MLTRASTGNAICIASADDGPSPMSPRQPQAIDGRPIARGESR